MQGLTAEEEYMRQQRTIFLRELKWQATDVGRAAGSQGSSSPSLNWISIEIFFLEI